MSESLHRARNIAKECLDEICGDDTTPTVHDFRQAARTATATLRSLDPTSTVDESALTKLLEADYAHSMPPWQILDEDEKHSKHEKWLDEMRETISWQYWDRYERYLVKNAELPSRVITGLGRSSGSCSW